jgi:endonuclease V-like protein UPF0215 family
MFRFFARETREICEKRFEKISSVSTAISVKIYKNRQFGLIESPVISYCFDRADVHRFFAQPQFFRRRGLSVNVRITVFVLAREIRRRSVAANVAINAIAINVKFARHVFRQSVFDLSHFYNVF